MLDENATIFETIDTIAVGDIRTQIKNILGAFMFQGDDIQKKVKVLSGGEKTRLAMIKLLLEPVNLLILDDYTDIVTLIGIEFDDNTPWGQLTILELKLLINLALQQLAPAKDLVESFLQYNTNTVDRGLFYQCMNVVLEVMLDDDLTLDDYLFNFRRMFGDEKMDSVLGSVKGNVRFYGLTPTSMKLEGLDRHQRLIDNYKKLHSARARIAANRG